MNQTAYHAHIAEFNLDQVTDSLRQYAKDSAFAHNHPDLFQAMERRRAACKRLVRRYHRIQRQVTWEDVERAGAGLQIQIYGMPG